MKLGEDLSWIVLLCQSSTRRLTASFRSSRLSVIAWVTSPATTGIKFLATRSGSASNVLRQPEQDQAGEVALLPALAMREASPGKANPRGHAAARARVR